MEKRHRRKNCKPPRRNPLGGFVVRAAPEQTIALHLPCDGRLRAESADPAGCRAKPSGDPMSKKHLRNRYAALMAKLIAAGRMVLVRRGKKVIPVLVA